MQNKTLEDIEELDIVVFYSFNSPFGPMENQRYVTDIDVEICTCDDQSKKKERIGKANLKILLLNLASDNGYSHYDVFDTEMMLFDLGEHIYDFEEQCIKEKIKKEQKFDLDNDIIKVSYIEILPEYRKMGLGKKLIKDFYNRFRNCCCLFIVKPFPIQHSTGTDKESEWYKKMQYDILENDFEIGKKKLQKFYSSLGFTKSKIAQDYMFLKTETLNEKLDLVLLD